MTGCAKAGMKAGSLHFIAHIAFNTAWMLSQTLTTQPT